MFTMNHPLTNQVINKQGLFNLKHAFSKLEHAVFKLETDAAIGWKEHYFVLLCMQVHQKLAIN